MHENEHWVDPRLVYVSNPTEVGTVYTKEELEDLYAFCKRHDLYFYIDGARLAAALAAKRKHTLLSPICQSCVMLFTSEEQKSELCLEKL